MKPECWKRMSSGKYIDLNNLTECDLAVVDIETALNCITRFTGHWKDVPPLTVAQHSLLCLNLAQILEPDEYELHLAVFIHDFAEVYIGDVATPVKKAMGERWHSFARPIEKVVERKFYGSYVDQDMHDRVKIYDLASLDIERRVMWKSQYGKDKWPASPLSVGSINEKEHMFNEVCGEYVNVGQIWGGLFDNVRV